MPASFPPTLDQPAVRRRLRAWYRRNARDLPWRRRPIDPYAIWLAEIMLQQTQVATAIPYYQAFLECYPTVADLARARRDDVLRMWAGLGYYRRAHQLHDAAITVAGKFKGEFPATVQRLMELPGIGRYTAGAIASIAFGARAPILDGNVKRVLARLTASRSAPDDPRELRRLWALADELLPARNPGDFNQALMELGALVCTPRLPQCARCPLEAQCAARQLGIAAQIPARRKRPAVLPVGLICLVVRSAGRVLATRRDSAGLWAGACGLPAIECHGAIEPARYACRLLPKGLSGRIAGWQPLGAVRHRLTHRDLTIVAYLAEVGRLRVPHPYRWIPVHQSSELPTVFRKVMALLETA